MDDPDADPEILPVVGALQLPVLEANQLAAEPLHANVGMPRPQGTGPVESGG